MTVDLSFSSITSTSHPREQPVCHAMMKECILKGTKVIQPGHLFASSWRNPGIKAVNENNKL